MLHLRVIFLRVFGLNWCMFVCIAVFCGIYVVHGLLKELEYEIYMFVCAAAFVLLYCIVEYIVYTSHRSEIKLVISYVVEASFPFFCHLFATLSLI